MNDFNLSSSTNLSNSRNEILENFDLKGVNNSIINRNEILISEIINPDEYVVGPNDIFFLNLISNHFTVNEYLTVSPLYDLILPKLGLINVENHKLTDMIKSIEKKYYNKFQDIEFNMTLTNIRKFKIKVNWNKARV